MIFFRKKIGKQGTWTSALLLLFSPLIIIFSIRWLLYEPFVIPSSSMMPNLMIHDHLFVEKFSYGIKMPFADGWLLRFKEPRRGDVVVFRFPQNRNVFFIKRLIGLPGDRIKVQNGQIILNDQAWVIRNVSQGLYPDETEFNYYLESVPKYELFENQVTTNALSDSQDASANEQSSAEELRQQAELQQKQLEARVKSRMQEDPTNAFDKISSHEYLIRLYSQQNHVDPLEREFVVPPGSYFVMGDNRDQSQDSRFWGFVPEELLIGRASLIWLSCDSTIPTAPMLCDPETIRRERLFKKVNEL